MPEIAHLRNHIAKELMYLFDHHAFEALKKVIADAPQETIDRSWIMQHDRSLYNAISNTYHNLD